ncbi:MAG: hypothetical protein JXR68_13005 [Bacteroidales bacterium]|nr:hypothetical protein [Bacteroidales bacterium]
MKTLKLFFLLTILPTSFLFSQETGWYIIQKKAQYKTAYPSGMDLMHYESNNKINVAYIDINNFSFLAGEPVFVFYYNQEEYYCFDPYGRIAIFFGYNSLKKAPDNCVLGLLEEDIPLLNGETLKKGSYCCVISQNISKNTYTIKTLEQYEIPAEKIKLVLPEIRHLADDGDIDLKTVK